MFAYIFAGFAAVCLLVGLPWAAILLSRRLQNADPQEQAGALKAGIWASCLTWGSALGTILSVTTDNLALSWWPLPAAALLSLYFCRTHADSDHDPNN